jgi:DNA (cytosine-5)-methyltransferase 1
MVNQSSFNELSLFSGAGGGILSAKQLGWRTICAVEWEPYPASVLCARQNDELLPPFPVWDDVQTFDGKPWRGIVDVVSGGFPCQDISSAGKGEGITGERSSMWKHMARIIKEVEPAYVFAENSPLLARRGLEVVLEDLASMGYDAEWGVLSAGAVGANHKRDRIWIVAHSNSKRLQRTHNNSKTPEGFQQSITECVQTGVPITRSMLSSSYFQRRADAMACWVDRLKAIGNGQVPLCASTAWKLLNNRLETPINND